MIDNPVRLESPLYQTYAVLTMCRILYTLHHGAVVTKPVRRSLGPGRPRRRWAALIDCALAWQPASL